MLKTPVYRNRVDSSKDLPGDKFHHRLAFL